MIKLSDLGKLEIEVLRFLLTSGPASVGEVASGFGYRHGYARTTMQTVMERLRKKDVLERREEDGGYVYYPLISQTAFFMGLVTDFVRDSLRQDITPIVAYLSESKGLTKEEAAMLKRIASKVGELEGGYV